MTVTVKQVEDIAGIDYSVRDPSLTDDVVKAQIRQIGRMINTEAGMDMSQYKIFDQIQLEGTPILMHNLMVSKKIIVDTYKNLRSPNIFEPLMKYKHKLVLVAQNF